MTGPALTVHVERTPAPGVLRWVCHRPDLDETPVPPEDSDLRRLSDASIIETLMVLDGDLLVGFANGDAQDRERVALVHRAIVDALADDGWLPHSGVTAVTIHLVAQHP